MMAALSAGGMVPVYDERRDRLNNAFGDDLYCPNAGGFFELGQGEEKHLRDHRGKLIKVLVGSRAIEVVIQKRLPYRIVFMKRHPEEIRQSFEAFWGNTRQITPVINHYDEVMGEAIQRLTDTGASVDIFQYREVVESPLVHFVALQNRGWPIQPEKSARIVNPALCRFRLEQLVVGI